MVIQTIIILSIGAYIYDNFQRSKINLLKQLLVKKDKIILELENENADLRVYKRLWQSFEENGNSYKT